MDLPSEKVNGWTIETAQMKHTARKYSMTTVVQSWLRKASAAAGVADYQLTLAEIRDDAEKYESLTEAQRDFCDTAALAGMWATVAACVKPYITLEEWLKLPEESINDLSAAVERLNPHWFVAPDQEKKTSALPPTPTPD